MLPRGKSRKLEPVGSLFAGMFKKLGLSEAVAEQRALQVWAGVVGEKVAAHTQAYSISDGVLLVLVDAHAWTQELLFLKPDILRRLNETLGSGIVKDIRFTLRHRRQG
jgi:predicted nucleic acid-binding Zn ribbon protein